MGAQGALKLVTAPEADLGQTMPDGSMVVLPEQLKRLGDGDVKRGRKYLRRILMDLRPSKTRAGPTARPQSVRMAGPADEIQILALLLPYLKKRVSHIVPVDPVRVLEHVRMGTQHKGGIVGVIDGTDGQIIGVTIMIACQSAFSKAWYIQEIFQVVHPDHRKSRHGEELTKFGLWCSDRWSEDFGYPVPISSTVHDDQNLDEKLRFFRRYMNQIGAVFCYPFPIVRQADQ